MRGFFYHSKGRSFFSHPLPLDGGGSGWGCCLKQFQNRLRRLRSSLFPVMLKPTPHRTWDVQHLKPRPHSVIPKASPYGSWHIWNPKHPCFSRPYLFHPYPDLSPSRGKEKVVGDIVKGKGEKREKHHQEERGKRPPLIPSPLTEYSPLIPSPLMGEG